MNERSSVSNQNQAGSGNWKWGVFSGSTLKYFVAVLMLCDHIAQMFPGAPEWLHMVGRLVFPIFMFMVAEGFYYTRSRKRYMLQLLVGFEVMNVLSAVIERNFAVHTPDGGGIGLMNSAFGTMFIMCLLLCFCRMIHSGFKEKRYGAAIGGIALLVGYLGLSAGVVVAFPLIADIPWALRAVVFIPTLLMVEGISMIPLGMLFYALRRWRWAQMLPLAALAAFNYFGAPAGDVSWMVIFAAIPLLLYNGKRGRGGRFNKYFFYIYYPSHIYALYILAWFLQSR